MAKREDKQLKRCESPKFSKHIRRNAQFLRNLAVCRSPLKRQTLLANAGPEQLLCIVECCMNILKGRVCPVKNRRKREKLKFDGSSQQMGNGDGRIAVVQNDQLPKLRHNNRLWSRLRACAPWIRALGRIRSAGKARKILLSEGGNGKTKQYGGKKNKKGGARQPPMCLKQKGGGVITAASLAASVLLPWLLDRLQ